MSRIPRGAKGEDHDYRLHHSGFDHHRCHLSHAQAQRRRLRLGGRRPVASSQAACIGSASAFLAPTLSERLLAINKITIVRCKIHLLHVILLHHLMNSKTIQSGFSLVELSIVLVILGLLTGGILAGQSLIRAAELRSVTADLQRYMTSVHTFRDKYFALPGDMTNATAFWGAAHATPATCETTASAGAATCNGDGDGQVEDGSYSSGYEMYRFWQHLANAGLIEGQYSGVAGPEGAMDHVIGVNCPHGRISNTGWGFSYLGTWMVGDAATYGTDWGNLFWFGAVGLAANNRPQSSALAPEEAWNIDTKTDDGRPGLGKVLMRSDAPWGNANACSTSTNANDYNGSYALTVREKVCALMVRNQ